MEIAREFGRVSIFVIGTLLIVSARPQELLHLPDEESSTSGDLSKLHDYQHMQMSNFEGDGNRGRDSTPVIVSGLDHVDIQMLGQAPPSKEGPIIPSSSTDGSLSLKDHLGGLTYYRGGVRPRDCAEVRRAGYPESGRYRVYPALSDGPVFVNCDMENGNGEMERVVDRHTVINPRLPHLTAIDGGMEVGRTIFVYGKIRRNIDRLRLWFQSSDAMYPKVDIPFVFVPRFRDARDGRVVVRNTYQNRRWGKEERAGNLFPFALSEQFEIVIRCEEAGYNVTVNNQHFTTYEHRMPYQKTKFLLVSGEADLQEIHIE